MSIMPEPTTNHDRITDSRLPGTVAELRAAAVTALQPYNPLDREHVESMLLFWRRRPEMTAADVTAVQEAMFPEPEVRTCGIDTQITDSTGHPAVIEVADGHVVHLCCGKLDDEAHRNFCEHAVLPDVDATGPRILPGYAHGLIEGYARAWGFTPRPRIPRDVALHNPDWREGYAEGFLDCIVAKVGVDGEALAAAQSLAARRDCLTDAELDAIRAAAAFPRGGDGGFAQRFLEEQRRQRRAAVEDGGQ